MEDDIGCVGYECETNANRKPLKGRLLYARKFTFGVAVVKFCGSAAGKSSAAGTVSDIVLRR